MAVRKIIHVDMDAFYASRLLKLSKARISEGFALWLA